MKMPLEGLRVIEVDANIATAYAGCLLRDSGAEVIKVEPEGGDVSRQSPGHRTWNRGKKSIVLAADHPRYADLLATADVILAGAGGSRLEGYQRRDDQIVALAPAYAEVYPYSNLPEDEELVAAVSGVLGAISAYREGPAFPVLQTASLAVAVTLAGAVGTAVLVRQRTGRGQEVKVPWTTVGAYIGVGFLMSLSDRIRRRPPPMEAQTLGNSTLWRVYRASDGWVAIANANPVFFKRLADCLETDLTSDPRFASAPIISPENQLALAEVISDVFAKRSQAEWVRRFAEFDVPGSAVYNRDQFLESDLVIENGMIETVEDPEVGQVKQVAMPLLFEGADTPGPAPAPVLNANADEILAALEGPRRPFAKAGDAPSPSHPLEGIRVLDFTGFLAGPTTGRLLAELGAEVIKVEPPQGEGYRNGGLSCLGINIGKKSIAVDSRTPEGRRIVERLIKSSDVLLQALIPGAPEKLGLDEATVKKINPDIIYSWISGFGAAKNWHGRPSFDILMQALSGQMFMLGSEEDDQPIFSHSPMADLLAGMIATYGIVVALVQRDREGVGPTVLTNQVAASMTAQVGQFVKYEGSPEPDVTSSSLGRSACNRLYAVKDGWVISAVRDATGWEAVIDVLGSELESWTSWNLASKQPVEGELANQLGTALAGFSRLDVRDRLMTKGAPIAPVVSVRDDFIDNIFFRDLGTNVDGIYHDSFGSVTAVANFYRFSETPSRIPDTAQWVGEQNREVLLSVGYTDAEIDDLENAKIIAAPKPPVR